MAKMRWWEIAGEIIDWIFRSIGCITVGALIAFLLRG